MTKPAIPQSQKRLSESLAALFTEDSSRRADLLILKSSSDVGVIRNGGRNGARYAPQSFVSYFKKLNQTEALGSKIMREVEVADICEELQDFTQAQLSQAKRIAGQLPLDPGARICHLGGGHDHIFPLLKSLGEKYKSVIVINVDAHADTRTDSDPHSGTPFRQFAEAFTGEFHLFQVGVHHFANSLSTLSPLSRGSVHYLWQEDLAHDQKVREMFGQVQGLIKPDTVVVFSLDADALNGAEMPGVSAVNGHGITRQQLGQLSGAYLDLKLNHGPIIGIYELNPVYDTLSSLSMRTMATWLYETLV